MFGSLVLLYMYDLLEEVILFDEEADDEVVMGAYYFSVFGSWKGNCNIGSFSIFLNLFELAS